MTTDYNKQFVDCVVYGKPIGPERLAPSLGRAKYAITTQAKVRDAFWLTFNVEGKPRRFYGKSQNDLPTDVRVAFCDFVEYLRSEGTISPELAQKVTL